MKEEIVKTKLKLYSLLLRQNPRELTNTEIELMSQLSLDEDINQVILELQKQLNRYQEAVK